MIRTPFDNLLASGTETGDAYTEPLVHVPLAGEFPEETTRRVVSNQLRKARDLASYGVPAYDDKFGDPQAVVDEQGAPLTGFSKKTNTAFDSLGVPRSLIRQPGGAAPVLGDAYEGAEIKTDQKTGAQFKVKPGLPKWRVGTDETVVKRNELAARDKELSKTAAIVGERLSLDQGAYVIGEHQQKAQKRELAGLLKEDFQGQAKIPDGTPFLDVRAQVAKFYDTALADKSASAKEFFSSNYTASAKANRDRLEARKAQALGHVDAMEQRAGMLAQQAELIAPAKEQKRQLAEQRIELHLQEMEARGLDTTPIRAQIARAAEVRAAAEQKAAAPQQPVAPQAAAAPEQGGNFLTDTGVSLGIGINSVLKMAGDLYGLATGNMDNPASKLGKENIEWYEGKKSGALQKVEKERRAAMDALPEDDETGRAWEWVKATFSSPRMITAMLAEQAPNLVPALGAGKLAGTGAAKILLKNASDDAAKAIALKTAGKIGVSAAVGTGAVMQGSDVGGDQYTELVALLHDMPPEQAAAIPEIADLLQRGATLDHAKLAFALTQARTTGALAGGVSIGSQLLPGARILERAAVGLGGKKLAGNIVVRAGKGFLGEGVQEMVEEGVGLGGKNVLAQPVDPTRRWDKGMGETLAMAGATGGILGAVGGAAGRGAADDGTDGTATPPPSGPAAPGAPGTPPTPDSPLNSDAIEQLVGIGIPRDKASQMTMEEAMDAVAAADEKLKAGQGTDIAPAADLAALDDATLDDKTRRMGLIVNQAAVDNSPQAPMLQAALDAMRAEKARREAAKPPAAPVIEQPETQGDAASVVAHTDDNAGSTPAPATLPAAPVDLAGLESSIKGNSDAALTSQPLNENTQTQGVPALPEAAPVQLPAAAKAVEPSSQAEVEPPPVTGQGPAPVAALKGAPATPAPAPAIPEDGMSSAEKGITYTPEDLTNVRFETGTVVRIKLDDGQEIEGEVEYAGTQPFFRGKKGEILALGNGMPDRDTIQSVSVVRSAVESLKAKDARKYGAPELPPPASRDDYERSLYTLSRRIHEENAKENFDGSRRSMQLQAQFDRMADEIELARTKRNYVRGNWRTYFKGGPMPRPIDYMDGPVDAKAQEPPKPSDFDPNREERKKRHDKPIEALPKLAEVRASLADAKQQLAKKSLAPERRAQMERIVAKREKELRDGLYVEAREQKADALPTAAPPTSPAPAKAAPAAKPSANQADADKLRDLEKVRYKTATQEKEIELLKARIKADPSKWSIGDGVAYRVNSGGKGVQLNRGFRITEINAAEKLARIVQVADTGLTSSGGDNDRIAAQWIHVAELVREKKYDKPPAKAAPAAEQPAPAPAAAPNNGDEVVFTPKSKRDSTVKGTLVETITNTSGNEGYHILAPLPGDPGRIVRVWKENGEIAVTKPYEQPTPKEAAKPEAKPASGMTVEEARQHLNRPGQIGGYTAESVMEKQQGRGKLAPAATPAAPAAKAGEGGAREAWIAAQMSLSNPPLDAGAPAWIARGDGTTRPSVWFRPPPGDVKATRTTAEKAFAAQYDYYEATRGTGNRDVQASAALQPSQAGGGNQKGGVDVGAGASPDWLDKPYPKPSDREIQQLSDADAARRVDVLNDVIAKESAAITALEKTPAQQRTELQVKAHAATWTRLSSARNALEDMKRAKPTPAAPAAPAAKAGEGVAKWEIIDYRYALQIADKVRRGLDEINADSYSKRPADLRNALATILERAGKDPENIERINALQKQLDRTIDVEAQVTIMPKPTAKALRDRMKEPGVDYTAEPNSIVIQVRGLDTYPVGDGKPITLPFNGDLASAGATIASGMGQTVRAIGGSFRESLIVVTDADGKTTHYLTYNPAERTVQAATREDIVKLRERHKPPTQAKPEQKTLPEPPVAAPAAKAGEGGAKLSSAAKELLDKVPKNISQFVGLHPELREALTFTGSPLTKVEGQRFTVTVIPSESGAGKGIEIVEYKDKPGFPVVTGRWMDQWEPYMKKLGVSKAEYDKLPIKRRAEIEATHQRDEWLEGKRRNSFADNFARTYHPAEWEQWMNENRRPSKEDPTFMEKPYGDPNTIRHWEERFFSKQAKPTPAAPAAKAGEGAKPVEKEPWQMTREDWVRRELDLEKQVNPNVATFDVAVKRLVDAGETPAKAREFILNLRNAGHEAALEKALREGKPVPAEVLADYPDLAKQPQHTAPAPAAKAGDIAGFVDSNGVTYDRKSGVWIDKSPRMGGRMTDPKAIDRLNEEAASRPAETVAPSPKPAVGETPPSSAPSLSVSTQSGIQDFGEKLAGQARKDIAASMKREISDDDIVRLPLSEIWPKAEVDAIEDIPLAALATAVRAEIPAKPRQGYKVKQWAEKVKQVRGLMRIAAERGYDAVVDKMDEYRLGQLVNKIRLLQGVPREHWGRIGAVNDYPEAYQYSREGGKNIPSPFADAVVDGRRMQAPNLSELTAKVNEALGTKAPEKKMEFEVRGRTIGNNRGNWNINKKGDPLYRVLKSFPDTESKEALAYIRSNHADLVAAWEGVKERMNVKETDVRRETNRDRTGKNWRDGKDATPEMFMESFGFKGAEFGNWVIQGKNVKERQGMLNAAFDALHDLADTVGIPPKAISLNGTLGLGFGSRGHGWASAHFEPGNLVINLTKTRGAGSLAHEWFHALDNYFQRKRNESGLAYGQGDYITNQPETYYESPRGERLSETRYKSITSNRYNAERMTDWRRVEGVRPQVAEAFTELVKVLDASPMSKRAALIDKGKSDGYWSRIIERAARSFENHIIAKMQLAGMSNDYLANVQSVEDFARDKGRYPYLLPDELAPVSAAFDSLFSTFKTEKTDSGVALFSAIAPQSISDVQPKHAIPAHIVSRIVDRLLARWPGAAPTTVIADGAQFPQAIRELAPPGLPLNRLGGAYHDGKVWINAAALGTAARVEQVFMHEQAGHHGVDGLLEGIAPGSRAKLAAQLQGHFPAQWAHVAGNYDAGLQVSETLARIHETFATNEATAKQASAWQRIVDWIRTTLAKAGFKAWSRADVEALLRRGIGRLRGEPGNNGGTAQFSIESEQRDKDYMAAVERGDVAEQQRMVDAAAKAAGYAAEVFHGDKEEALALPLPTHTTKYEPINDFRKWTEPKIPFFTTTEKSEADWYGPARKYHVKVTNPLRHHTYEDAMNFIGLIRRAGFAVRVKESGGGWDIPYEDSAPIRENSPYEGDNLNDWIYVPEVRNQMRKEGYDGMDASDAMSNYEIPVLVPLDPSQIKSADPITRDADGRVIPLSQRFNPATPDIRFSIESDPADPIRHGIKNAMTEADRIFYDLLPRAEIKRRSLESIVAQAKALVENSPEEAERIFEGVKDGSAPVTDINEMVVLQLLARTKTAMNRVQATINDGKGKADGLDALMKQRGELKDRMQRLVDTSAAAGREASSALNVRRAVVDEDYSYAGILATMQADNRGVPLTEAQEKIAEVMAPKLEAAAKERTAAQVEVDMQAVYDEVLADIEQRIKDAAEFEGTEKEMGERGKKAARAKKAGIDWFKPGAASFSLEGDASAAKSEKGDANAKAPPPIPKDAYKVVMEYAVSAIQSGSAAESAFNAEVEMEFGPKIKPYLADIFKTATKMKSLMAVKTKEGKTVRKPKVKETTADIAARIGKERDADPEASLDPTDIVGMVRANVEAGAGGGVTGEGKAVLAEAIRMTTEQLQEEGIELTEDEVRDAFTQYGQKTKLKKDSLSVKMREIRRIGQLVSAVRDAVQGKKEAEAALAAGEKPTSLTKPQLTGLEREKATQAVRDMDKARIAAIKELQEAASALGIDIGGAGSMASTLAAAKTRMTNAIEDVEREIRTKQRIQRSKKGVNYDAEATELKAKLDARRKERDEIFGPSELTDEQRLAAALAAAIRNEKEWNSKLVMAQLGIFEPTASTYRPVTSPELEEIKARTAAAREAVADLKAADSATQEAAKEKQLEARIAELEKQLASGIIAAPEKQQTAETQRVTELTARRDELKKAITARRKANQPVPDAEQKKLEALESQLARLIENKPKAEKAATVDTAEQAFARQQLEAARAELAEKRKNQPFDPDAWLAKTEKAIATRTAKLEERLASGDILPPVKAERPTSPALEAARHKYDKLIGELNRQRFKLELANRSRAGKFFGSIAEILQTSRAIITGGELSAVLRQGGFSTLGHPILGMQSAGEMLKSFVSERKAHTVQDEVNHWLQGSPMRVKLDITQHSGIRKHHMEEAYMSRWINENIPAWLRKIPVLGFGIETGRRFIAASARAYSTYLNVLRMKVAKNLLKTLPLNPAKPTQAEIQQIADFVNASTGRGKMPKRWQGGAVALNTLFFAPKNFISRVQLLIGQPLWHGTMRTRLIVAKEYARFLIGAATILALAKLGQDDDDPPIETDLRSSDFLKVRFGNTRLDIFSGLIQPLVFAGRTGTLETKTIAGKVKSLHGEAVKYGGDDWSDVAFRFGRTKFAPAPSATFDLLSGRNVVGQPASATDIGANMIIPMTFRDIAHAMEEQGATKGTILSMLAILGMGVNTFSDRKQTPPTGMNADAVVLKSRHELPVPSLSQKSKRPVFQGF